ncbi:MAG TPA: N-acetylglucosamine kinase [Chitinophagaceae bacterium]|nr:N-acetylglucosamine kinase [Chitinophagaceae bacterium]
MAILIADSGATKCEWCYIGDNGRKKKILTQGISLYFLSPDAIETLLLTALIPKMKLAMPNAVHFYGTGMGNADNVKQMKKVLKRVFPNATIDINTDLLAAARSLCGTQPGIACILGTGSNSGFYNGKKIVKTRPGLGYVLGDEGSGAYLGKRVIQHYLYEMFDNELLVRFNEKFNTSRIEILDKVYKQPLPNRYLASFAIFLAENRGHYMIENIVEDGLNEFFFTHLYKYREAWSHPIHFTGSVAYGCKDVLSDLCNAYELELGNVSKNPMDGLAKYHNA